eukprot:s104_g3.t1
MAMISIAGIWAAELVTKKDAVEQLMSLALAAQLGNGICSVSPVQVRGGRWYCAMLQRSDAEESGSGVTRQCGPLRMSHQDAAEDLKRLQEAKDENLKRKSEAPQEAEPAPKRGKAKD